ncbi:hypothetical protein BD324DRAFT_647757 [Kockovaella imperatae]|uniref:Uncharacterized protein n=1 Tax=Kockovaella imperatae TaxID=4999 RepID=A0A1Y1USC8_9TREE|nr:hypothetical protein BD324DRAFT_647757 [Kockovaella imperatae]ORX40852.1 hypothetical protein BD324DRAFT_647757 [Kockovaella imperatae]
MQSIQNAASQAASVAADLASQATTQVSSLAGQAAEATGLGVGGHSHAEEHLHRSTLPPDSQATPVKKMDTEGLAVFEGKHVRHDVLVKINQLAIDDKRHGLKELASLDLVTDEGKKGIDYYHPLRYFTVQRPMGEDFIGEVELEAGRCIHIRCHKASPTTEATFHSIDTRPSEEGGAIFTTGEPLGWFDY